MAGRKLWSNTSLEAWESIWEQYEGVIQQVSVIKKSLDTLDAWYLSTLPSLLHERDPDPYISHTELKILMEWKLKKGKWRPQLMKHIENLDSEIVSKTSKTSLEIWRTKSDLKKSIEGLCKLKGVGPATASAVLAAYDNDVPFMADEALESISHVIGPRVYTLKHYLAFSDAMQHKASSLNKKIEQEKAEDEEKILWNAQRVQLCLYAQTHLAFESQSEQKKSKKKDTKRSLEKSIDTEIENVSKEPSDKKRISKRLKPGKVNATSK